jgi:hypothetical protein
MDKELTVELTQTKDLQPLAVVCNLPGLNAEMPPAQMRALAAALRVAAEECESRPMGKNSFLQVTKSYGLAGQGR